MNVTTEIEPKLSKQEFPMAGVRRFGAVNWLGTWTLYTKEVRRFTKIMTQTIFAPMITTLLYMAVFSLSVGKVRHAIHGIPFIAFLAPGLIMMRPGARKAMKGMPWIAWRTLPTESEKTAI